MKNIEYLAKSHAKVPLLKRFSPRHPTIYSADSLYDYKNDPPHGKREFLKGFFPQQFYEVAFVILNHVEIDVPSLSQIEQIGSLTLKDGSLQIRAQLSTEFPISVLKPLQQSTEGSKSGNGLCSVLLAHTIGGKQSDPEVVAVAQYSKKGYERTQEEAFQTLCKAYVDQIKA